MATLEQFKGVLVDTLGFKEHQINTGEGDGIASTVEGLDDKAEFLVTTTVGNCYAAFNHDGGTLSEAEANRYKALSILMPNGPAAYCVVQTGENLRLFYVEKGNELHDSIEEWDNIRDAEDMVKELKADVVTSLEQWARKTLHTENSLSRFVQLMKGCWQDIWDIENKRNDWIFDEFTRFLFIKLNEDGKPNGAFTTAKFKSYCSENKHMGDKAGQNFINNLFDDLKIRHPEVFTDENERVLSKSETVKRVITRLEDINLKDTQGDVLGRAFEIMLSDTFKGKDLGQFFTPREIVSFMLDLARENPEASALDLDKGQRFLDACAGSGGFLIATYEDVYKHTLFNGIEPGKKEKLLKRLGQSTFFASEIEEKAARLGKLNMIIHAVDQQNANWIHQNYIYNEEYGGLKPKIEYEVDFGAGKQKQQIGPNSIDLILTNPPFGKSVKNNSILLDYTFGHDLKVFKTKSRPPEKRAKNSQDSEVLFIEHYLRVLKPGGKLLIVLPDGVLSNATAKPVRDFMRENALIKAVISLPSETFASTGTSIPTNVVYLQKKRPGDVQGDIFMARADYVGRRANGEPLKEDDLPFILEKFREWQSGTLRIPEEDNS
ncbi:MAG: N-6 DNA methylase [Candidatus Marinimicrobia bacterium]|nr:N-6 DNA methylase [Candidatus Neomarinimicrobiota bacterium]